MQISLHLKCLRGENHGLVHSGKCNKIETHSFYLSNLQASLNQACLGFDYCQVALKEENATIRLKKDLDH